ncbi:hypothetical protein CLV85_0941 [Salinibacterium amurskyense]|uniref:Uncharacterized protein n=1 Tax=Salinibacterium amurskyense TaxID=205941 RepID=A0A2M9D7W9_9MICO|nr:hypothetical protein CLV85_0941 [Salinibacterium amurskyense]GHD79371.1 hypothetical protein GCM10007394_08770 [Salinibacterium amurskyense]
MAERSNDADAGTNVKSSADAMSSAAADSGVEPDPAAEATSRAKRSKSRRVTTPPPAGSDPHPTGEPERHQNNENDERLKGDKPPHWG